MASKNSNKNFCLISYGGKVIKVGVCYVEFFSNQQSMTDKFEEYQKIFGDINGYFVTCNSKTVQQMETEFSTMNKDSNLFGSAYKMPSSKVKTILKEITGCKKCKGLKGSDDEASTANKESTNSDDSDNEDKKKATPTKATKAKKASAKSESDSESEEDKPAAAATKTPTKSSKVPANTVVKNSAAATPAKKSPPAKKAEAPKAPAKGKKPSNSKSKKDDSDDESDHHKVKKTLEISDSESGDEEDSD